MEKGEAAIITGGADRFYFTGFNSSAGTLIITRGRAFFLIDFRYFEKAKQVVKSAEVILLSNLYNQINELLNGENINTVYLDIAEVNIEAFLNLKNALSPIEVSSSNKISKVITELRSVKDSFEIENIKAAQSITDEVFSYILNKIELGKTEREIALDLEFFARKKGSDGVAFDFIVVSGKNSSLPHGVPTEKQLKKGDFVTMDFGARVNGYCSDMTRTVALKGLSDEQKTVYNIVLEAQNRAFEKIKPNAVCYEVDAAAREYIDKFYPGTFGHALGHSLGIDIHERPSFNTRDNTVLKSGTVITVEPGIYIENRFGVRIEDTVIVTNTGYENIAKSPKELIII